MTTGGWLRPGDRVLFQGDSITDCGRGPDANEPNIRLGSGYAMIAAAWLLVERPKDRLSFWNRGISGNRVVDLYARIRKDVINLGPTVLSVLIGVNDTWHEFGSRNGVPVPKFERIYRALLSEVREALPEIRLVLGEPFVLRCGVVTEAWLGEMAERQGVVQRLAAEFGALLVPFQKVFDEAIHSAPPEYWAADGVHPTYAGHMRMAQAWVEHVTAG